MGDIQSSTADITSGQAVRACVVLVAMRLPRPPLARVLPYQQNIFVRIRLVQVAHKVYSPAEHTNTRR